MNSIARLIVLFPLSFAADFAGAAELGLPLDCEASGVECRVQQYVDMATGPDERDPFCGAATYDGHKGTDFRVLSMRDVAKAVPVIAMADGEVLRTRDGEPDHLVRSDADRAAVADKECGNGVVIASGNDEIQYCHLRQGSISVKPGAIVEAGDKLGEVGASGMAQFPHVHVTVRNSGEVVDPMTGNIPDRDGSGCMSSANMISGLWSDLAAQALAAMTTPLLSAGISGSVPEHSQLSESGPPEVAQTNDSLTVGWVWLANLRKGDQVELVLKAPDGSVFSQNRTEPLERNKADYSAYVGRKRPPVSGKWTMDVSIIRSGEAVFRETESVIID